jgi:poly-gamma-glutamate synthesis protein (capsule biosynthesis protein)
VDVDLAHDLLAAGAALVVGHHPHILQGIERTGSGLVAYSLGNFVFTTGSNPLTAETGILEVTVTRAGVQEARFVPMVIREGQPHPADRGARRRILARLDRLSRRWSTAVAADGTITAREPAPP